MAEKNLQLFTYDELADADIYTPYLIDPILPMGGIGMVYGKGGHGKTSLVFRMIKDITENRPFLGLYEVEPCEVLFIQADMPIGIFQERVRAARPIMETDRIHFAHTDPLNIQNEDHQEMVADLVERTGARFVVYDTLHKLHYLDENDAVSSRLVYDDLREAVGAADGVTSLVIHHSRKGFYNPYKDETMDSDEDMRGHTGWRDDADMAIRVRKDDEDKGHFEAAFTRLRCADQKNIPLAFDEEHLIMEPNLDAMRAKMVAMTFLNNGGQIDDLVGYLTNFGPDGWTERHAYRIKSKILDLQAAL